jgi:hypothetical protein
MDELKKLYEVLVREGKYTKSFDEFQNKWSNDEPYKDKVYEVVKRDGIYSKDKDSFLQKYSSVTSKKKVESTGTSEEAPSVSPVQQTKAKSFSVGGKPLQTGASASSAGKNKALFGAPVQSFTEQKSKEFKEAKKKEIAVIDNKPVVDITSQFNVKPKTFK